MSQTTNVGLSEAQLSKAHEEKFVSWCLESFAFFNLVVGPWVFLLAGFNCCFDFTVISILVAMFGWVMVAIGVVIRSALRIEDALKTLKKAELQTLRRQPIG